MKKIISFLIAIQISYAISLSQVYNPVSYAYNGTPSYGVKIKTNLPFINSSQMPTIIFEGYNYGGQSSIGLTLNYYTYDNIFYAPKLSSWGGWTPTVKLTTEEGKVVIFIDERGYFQRFNVRVFASGFSELPAWFEGWSIVDEQVYGNNTITVDYQNNFAGVVNLPGNGLWNYDGKVGIGTTTPITKLHINNGPNSDAAILATSSEDNKLIFSSGSTSPANCETFRITQQFYDNRNNGFISFYRGGSVDGGFLTLGTNGTERLRINTVGNVGIGTSDPGVYKLNVSGNIRANEIIVNTSGADFVFDPEYNLPDLAEVENFIKENRRLPDVAHASEMQSEGMNVSEMQTKLLQKMEEMTLYIIDQEKRIKLLEEKLKEYEPVNP
ncbi:MAG TPA: hypothetical protein VHO50_04470 [Bacteroidales bacterium]|nr:hypothetical protein [Bacteroidales bacterium]